MRVIVLLDLPDKAVPCIISPWTALSIFGKPWRGLSLLLSMKSPCREQNTGFHEIIAIPVQNNFRVPVFPVKDLVPLKIKRCALAEIPFHPVQHLKRLIGKYASGPIRVSKNYILQIQRGRLFILCIADFCLSSLSS